MGVAVANSFANEHCQCKPPIIYIS